MRARDELPRSVVQRTLSAAAALLLAVALLVSCGDDAGSANGDAVAARSAAPTQASDNSDNTEDFEGIIESDEGDSESGDSPIEAMLGVPIMDDGAMNDHMADLLTEGERRTAECMLAEGFEYTPVVVGGTGPSALDATDDREFAKQHGFGVVAGFDAAEFEGSAPTDRNAEYVATLDVPEREAYEMALYGELTEDAMFDGGFPQFDGCKAKAITELETLFGIFEEFDAPAQNIFDQFDADPRLIDLYATWSRCMAEAGFTNASNPNEVRELVFERMSMVVEREDAYQPVDIEPDDRTFDPRKDWSMFLSGDFFGPHPPLTDQARADLDEVAEFERDLALTHVECYEPLEEEELAIQREYEQRLVDEIGSEVQARLDGG